MYELVNVKIFISHRSPAPIRPDALIVRPVSVSISRPGLSTRLLRNVSLQYRSNLITFASYRRRVTVRRIFYCSQLMHTKYIVLLLVLICLYACMFVRLLLYYLRQGGYVFVGLCLSVCVCAR